MNVLEGRATVNVRRRILGPQELEVVLVVHAYLTPQHWV